VLVMAGALKRKESTMAEEVLLIRAMKEANIPKFIEEDIPLFEAIIVDLFPSAVVPQSQYGDLLRTGIFSTHGLQTHNSCKYYWKMIKESVSEQ